MSQLEKTSKTSTTCRKKVVMRVWELSVSTLQRHSTANSKQIFPETELMSTAQYQVPHSYVCKRFLYSHHRSAYSAAGKYVDCSWELYILRSQTHECGNWDWGRAIPRKKYINGIFVAVQCTYSWFSLKHIRTTYTCLLVINLKTLCTRRARWSGVKAGVKARLEDDIADTADTFFFVIVENLPWTINPTISTPFTGRVFLLVQKAFIDWKLYTENVSKLMLISQTTCHAQNAA